MTYPPPWRHPDDNDLIVDLLTHYPFAQLITGDGGLNATRVPFVTDLEDGRPTRLRAHLNGQNPQASILEGAEVLIVFSGPHSYVSPHWRTSLERGPTYDYQEVRIRGTARIEPEMAFFVKLVNALAKLVEPQHAEMGDYPVWHSSMTPDGYVERLFPLVTSFTVEISRIELISKLHQHFPAEDRKSIVQHLERSSRTDSKEIAKRIRQIDT